MKPKIILFAATIFFSLSMDSCIIFNYDDACITGEGPIIERELSLPEFNRINLESSFDIIVSQGPEQSVVAVGHENIIENLNTRVVNEQWTIGLGQDCFSDFDLVIYVTLPSVDKIKLSGSGNIELDDFNQDNDLTVSISGSGDFSINSFEKAKKLEVSLQGSGTFYAKKQIECFTTLNLNCTGSGTFKGFPILVEECNVSVEGSGRCFVFAGDELNVSIVGSGDVLYKGTPSIVSTITGSGRLKCSN